MASQNWISEGSHYQAIYCDYGLCRAILGGEKVKFGRFGGNWHPLTNIEDAIEGDIQDCNGLAESRGHTHTPGDAKANGNTELRVSSR
jgi:hypothetical protein